jgi:hypothetical protein
LDGFSRRGLKDPKILGFKANSWGDKTKRTTYTSKLGGITWDFDQGVPHNVPNTTSKWGEQDMKYSKGPLGGLIMPKGGYPLFLTKWTPLHLGNIVHACIRV